MNMFAALASDFFLDVKERVQEVESLLLELPQASPGRCSELIIETKRELHTLKGNAGMMDFLELQQAAHTMEDVVEALDPTAPCLGEIFDLLDQFRVLVEQTETRVSDKTDDDGAAVQEHEQKSQNRGERQTLQDSVRVSFSALDELVDMLAEMVIFRNRLRDGVINGPDASDQEAAWIEVQSAEEALGATLNVIQDHIMTLRMVPLHSLFVSLKRIVHSAADRLRKQINLETCGGNTPMDKALLEVASEALGHLVRNAAIHGIEEPAQRQAQGKPATGKIKLTAATQANEVIIDITDDGRGIEIDRLIARARQQGIDVAAHEDPLMLLFQAELSTQEDADIGAGRGMGLVSARESVQRLGGRISVSSQPGEGTRFRLHLPLSVSVTRALLVEADGELYALPIANVEESLRCHEGDLTEINHGLVLTYREEVLSLVDVGYAFSTTGRPRRHGFTVIIEAAGRRRGLQVDRMAGIREIVVKGLDPELGSPAGISGSTILGDGRVVLILDPTALVAMSPLTTQGECT